MFRINHNKWLLRSLSTGLILAMAITTIGCGKTEEVDEQESELANYEVGEEDLLIGQLDANPASAEEYYETATVIRGDFNKKQAFDATTVTPYYENITLAEASDLEEIIKGHQTVLFQTYETWSGATVSEGDALFSFSLSMEVDPITLEEARISLERSEEDYNEYVANQNKENAKRYAEILKMEEGYDKQIQLAQYAKQQLQNEKNLTRMTESLEKQKEAYAKMQDATIYYVKAPIAGTVSLKKRDLEAGDEFSVSDILMTINDTSRLYLVVEDKQHQLRVGQSVNIGKGNGKNKAEGSVVAAPSAQTPMMSQTLGDCAYIDNPDGYVAKDLEETMSSQWWVSEVSYNVIADVIEEKDVILVPNKFVGTDNGKCYVNVLSDGKIHKRQFTSGGFNGEYYWAVEGLEEGTIVVEIEK